MRSVLALVAMTAVAAAQPAPVEPAPPPAPSPSPLPVPAPEPTAPALPPAPSPETAEPPAPEPAVDPAYGERPDAHTSTRAITDEDTSGARRRDIVVRYHPDRTRDNMVLLAALGGAGLVFGGIGLYFHLDATSAIDAVQADHFTGDAWSARHQDDYDRAYSSSIVAGVSYGIGGALLLATAITYIVTEPEMTTRVVRPYSNSRPISYVTPLRGGAFVGRGWTF